MNIEKYVKRELKKIAGFLNKRKIEKEWTIEIPFPVYHIIKPFLSEHLHCQVITEHLDKSQWTDSDGFEHKMDGIRIMNGERFIVQWYDYNRPLLIKYIDYLNNHQEIVSFEEYLNSSIAYDCLNILTSAYAVDDESIEPEFFTTTTASVLLYTLYNEQKPDFKKTVKIYSQIRGWHLNIDSLKEIIVSDIDKIRIIARYNKNIELFEYDYIYKSTINTYHLRVTADDNGNNHLSEYNQPTVSVIQTPNESPLTYDEIQLTDDGLKLLEMKYYDENDYYEFDTNFLYHIALMTRDEFAEYLNSKGYIG
ncbi:hypothetical protein ACI51W_03510 [Pseudomonas marginalis]|uniref:hypothetical protein n=1 Tax=Pseudomonas marginalis TaxID=298 RepID=UPI0038653FE4